MLEFEVSAQTASSIAAQMAQMSLIKQQRNEKFAKSFSDEQQKVCVQFACFQGMMTEDGVGGQDR
eukprot:768696-Hanusia_phi.AAC.1